MTIDELIDQKITQAIAQVQVNITADVTQRTVEAINSAMSSFPKPYLNWESVRPMTPEDYDKVAIPYDNYPGYEIAAATTSAINRMFNSERCIWFAPGTYWVIGTVGPGGNVKDCNHSKKQIYFNDTEIKVAPDARSFDFFVPCDQGSGLPLSVGLNDRSNLPPSQAVGVVWDLTNSDFTNYTGHLTIDCSGKKLIAMAAVNRWGQNGVGGRGATWDAFTLTGGYSGMFGTPRYSQERKFYAPAFVGNIAKRVRITNMEIPMLSGGNQFDDMKIDELNIINKAGGRSYFNGIGLVCDTIYIAGESIDDYVFDVRESQFSWQNLYAEKKMAAPIILRDGGKLKGDCKYGAGDAQFKEKVFIHAVGKSGSGQLGYHPRTLQASDMSALIKLDRVAGACRVFDVFSGGSSLPFISGSGTAIPNDKLRVFDQMGADEYVFQISGAIERL